MRAISPQLLEDAYGDPNKKHVFMFVFDLDQMLIKQIVYADTEEEADKLAAEAIAEDQDIDLEYAEELMEEGTSFQLT